MVVSTTGLLLALKAQFAWIRPATELGAEIEGLAQVAPLSKVAEAAFSAGIPALRGEGDIERFEYHRKKNVFKIHSREGYWEVQVCGSTARVLATGVRNDQFFEDLHDLSFFAEPLRYTLLPVVAVGLFALSVSGVAIALVPVVRRARFRKRQSLG